MSNGHGRLFWFVTGLAFVVRAIHIWVMSDATVNPLFAHPIMDSAMHDRWALGLLDGSWPGADPFFRAPLYIYVLAGLYAVLGPENRLAIQIAHALISACGAGLAAICAGHWFGRRAGWLAGLVFATLWTSIYFAGELLVVTLTTTLNLLLLWLLMRGDQEEDPTPCNRSLVLVGLVWGLSAVARPNVLILAPVIVWYLSRHRGVPWRSRRWLFLVIGLILPVIPVATHNVLRGGDAVLIASQGGVNFYIGNNHYSNGRTAYVPGTLPSWQGGFDTIIALAEQETGRHDLKPSAVDRYFLAKGIGFWFQEPGRALRLYVHKMRLLLAMVERSNNKNIYFWRERSQLLRWPFWLGWTTVLVLAVLGFFRRDLTTSRRFLLLGFAVAYAFSIYLFFVNARFRLPLLALLAVAAGGGLDRLLAALATRRWPDPRRGVVIAAGILVLSVLPDLVFPTSDQVYADPFSWQTIGNGYVAAGRYERARQSYEKAIGICKRYPQRHFATVQESLYNRLANVFTRLGRPGEASRVLGEYISLNPTTVDARVTLGDLLLQDGRIDDAAAQYEVALRNAPDHYGAQMGHAWILLHNGEAGAALRRFMALSRRHGNPQVLRGAGMCQIELGQWVEAEKSFRQALHLKPDYWQALGNLAELYERSGQWSQADEAYRTLLAVNPRDERARRWFQR